MGIMKKASKAIGKVAKAKGLVGKPSGGGVLAKMRAQAGKRKAAAKPAAPTTKSRRSFGSTVKGAAMANRTAQRAAKAAKPSLARPAAAKPAAPARRMRSPAGRMGNR